MTQTMIHSEYTCGHEAVTSAYTHSNQSHQIHTNATICPYLGHVNSVSFVSRSKADRI